MVNEIDTILTRIVCARGIDFSGYRHSMLCRRISVRMAKLGISDVSAYVSYLDHHPAETDLLIDAIAINVSSFFRNPHVFEFIAYKILPGIVEAKNNARGKTIRVWSAGCAAGEEIYSIAILVHELLQKKLPDWDLFFFGTDIDISALTEAQKASYPRERFTTTKLGLMDRYFDAGTDSFKLKPEICQMVRFSREDLTSAKTGAPAESVYGDFDMILCRNVLIYFNPKFQDNVVRKFSKNLVPGGVLVLGENETVRSPSDHGLCVVDRDHRIYRSVA